MQSCQNWTPTKNFASAARVFAVTLYKPEIPNNTGNISRLCVATNCELYLVGQLGFSLDNKKLRRAGLDHWPYLKMTRVEDLSNITSKRFALFSKFADRPYWQHPFEVGDHLVFGQETKGLPQEFVEQYREHAFALPMLGPVRSINLANAVAAVVYEGLRQLTNQKVALPLHPEIDPSIPAFFDVQSQRSQHEL